MSRARRSVPAHPRGWSAMEADRDQGVAFGDPRADWLREWQSARDPAASEAVSSARASTAVRAQGRHRLPGGLVEFIRLIVVALGTVAGWEIAAGASAHDSTRLVAFVVLGSGAGYVLGGVFGRTTASAVSDLEREFSRVPAHSLLAGAFGLIAGAALATLLSIPLFHLPAVAAYSSVAFLYAISCTVGYQIGRAKSEELFAAFGVKPKAAGTGPAEMTVLDSSALLDGRTLALVRLGFLSGTMLVTRGVLDELQAVADSSNSGRRARGRRALDLLADLKRSPSVDVVFVEDDRTRADEPTDATLVRLARTRAAALLTNDAGLAKVAAALDVPVRSLHALAEAMRAPVFAGDRVSLRLLRRGRESGQAIGYLEDGTMMVVERAAQAIGQTVVADVTNAIQTSTGQLVFGRLANDETVGEEPAGAPIG